MKKLSKIQFVCLNVVLLITLIGSGGFLPVIYKLLLTCILFFFAAWFLLSRSPFSKKMSFIIVFLPILLIYGLGYIYALVYDESYIGKPFFWTYLVLAIILYFRDKLKLSKPQMAVSYVVFVFLATGLTYYTTTENRAKKINQVALNQVEVWDKKENRFSFDSFKGKLTVMEFWTIGCGNCAESLTKLQNFSDRYKHDERINFFMVNVENRPNAERLASIEAPYHLEKLYIQKEDARKLNIRENPGILVLNPEGEIVFAGYPNFNKFKHNYIVDILEKEISKL